MEFIDKTIGIRSKEQILAANKVLTSLDDFGTDTSLYDISLLDMITKKEYYVRTRDGRIYNGSVKCAMTKQKDSLSRCKFVINVTEMDGKEVFQFMLLFPDGTWIDARGQYAATRLKIVQRRSR